MNIRTTLYPGRSRSFNVDLIKNIFYANSQASYDKGNEAFVDNLHPSLYAELDWMEENVPSAIRENAKQLVDALFLNNLERIIALREIEFELEEDVLFDEVLENRDFFQYIFEIAPQISKSFKTDNYNRILNAYNQTKNRKSFNNPDRYKNIGHLIYQKLHQLNDKQNLPLLLREVLLNEVVKSLDHIASRTRTKNFVRKTGMEVFNFSVGEIESEYKIMELRSMLQFIDEKAKEFQMFPIQECLNQITQFLTTRNILNANTYEGEKAVGYGPCGHCSMMFASSAIISLDPTCPFLSMGSGELIHLPIEFNSARCPFCGEVKRIDTPAMFYRPDNHKVIFNAPTLGQYSQTEAEDVHRDTIMAIRERYINKISPSAAREFDNAGVEVTYSMPHFITSVQMGTTNHVWHAFLMVKFADGSSAIVDKTTNTIIDLLSPSEVDQMWDLLPDDQEIETINQEHRFDSEIFSEAKEAYHLGDYDKAEQLFQSIKNNSPDNQIVDRYLTSVYLHQGKTEKSIKENYV